MFKENDITKELLSGIVPEGWTDIFELTSFKEKHNEFDIALEERADLVPDAIKNKDWVLNGYCKALELMDFPLRGKPVYIKIKRRRWKIRGEGRSYANPHDLNYPGVKATKEFADFLKGLDREALDEFLDAWPVYRRMWEKDTSLVQRFLKRFQR